ncbi:MAG: helix-hairpin-helix domain-containing protein, partial [Bacteroidales bacterium]
TKYQTDNQAAEYGYMVYQDIFYDLLKIPLSLNTRFAVFDTESYNTRIYAYESDILYAFSIPAYYSKGTRFYFNLKYTLAEFIDLWIRYSQTYYADKDVISSGLNQISGNTKSEIKAQLRFKL